MSVVIVENCVRRLAHAQAARGRLLTREERFDHLLIESTGISEPLPVAETFTFRDEQDQSLSDLARRLEIPVSSCHGLVGTLKAALMVLLLSHDWAGGQWLVWLNGVFAALYAVSFAVTYRALAQPAIRV